jgi:glucan phosphoethanolaminetransferase (alkaline phosphatase superfamily)
MTENPIGAPGRTKQKRRLAWVALLVITLMVLAVVLIPVWLIQPFRAQTRRDMEVAYALRRWSPLLTLFASAVALLLILWLWRGARRWWRKSALVLMLVLMAAGTWLTRQNHFEWMFNPLSSPAYAKTNDAAFVSDSDRVLAIEINGEAVAYPIRLMAYHHLVQDTVGGTPLVATY